MRIFMLTFCCCFLNFSYELEFLKQEVLCWPEFRDLHVEKSTLEVYERAYGIAKSLINYQETPRIPKIIHQIWLGSPVPKKFAYIMDTWKEDHPDWHYKLWTDENVKNLKMLNSFAFKKASTIELKTEILKLEILYREGGLFVGPEQESFFPHDIFHYIVDLYLGFSNSSRDEQEVIGSSVIGASVRNVFIKKALIEIYKNSYVLRKSKKHKELFLQKAKYLAGPRMLLNLLKSHFTSEFNRNSSITCVVFPRTFFFQEKNKDEISNSIVFENPDTWDTIYPWTYSVSHPMREYTDK